MLEGILMKNYDVNFDTNFGTNFEGILKLLEGILREF